ncbi:DoxX family protein [Dyella agri]|uniref:DoxX family protein n=1 Tax=Dyella agri TaxID=1926869 RepID=A0ABW8KI91_9GAMM
MNAQVFSATNVASSPASGALSSVVPAIGRVLISTLFLLAGFSKIAAPAMTIGYIQSVGLPLPAVAFALAAFTEIVGGILLVLGYRTRIVAGVLFVFSLATAAFFHNHLADQNQFIHFFKNVAIAGGLLNVMAFGGGRLSLDGRRA